MVTAAKLNADLLANDAKFKEGFDRAATTVGRFAQQAQKDIHNVNKQMDKLIESVTGIKGAIGTIGTIAGITIITKDALDSAVAVKKLGEQLGLTTDQVQRYQFAALKNNVAQDSFLTGFDHLNKLIAEGKVPYKDLNSAIGDIADRMQNASTGTQRAQIAFDMFGKQGKELIPMLIGGRTQLKAYGDEAERLGTVLPEETIKRAAEFKEQIDTLGSVISKNFQAGMLKEFTDDSGKIKDIYTDQSFVRGVQEIGAAFGSIAAGMISIAGVADKVMTVIGAVSAVASTNDKDVQKSILDEMNDRLGGGKGTPLKIDVPNLNNGASGSPLLKPPGATSQLDAYIKSLNAETDAIGMSEKALFEQKAVTEAATKARTDYKNLLRPTAELTEEETQKVKGLADQYYDLKNAQQQAEKFNQEFKSGFMDAVESVRNGSKTIGGAIRDMLLDFDKLIEKELVMQPLADAIFGAKGSGGLGGLLAGLGGPGGIGGSQGSFARITETGSNSFVGPLPSYDVGTSYVPNDQVAQVHRGEGILTPAENRAYQNGAGGGDTYIDARGANTSEITQLKALIMSLAGPGRVEDRIKTARQRGMKI